MWLDHICKIAFETHIFLKPLYLEVFVKLTLLKNSPRKESFLTRYGEFFNKVRRVF